MTNLDSVLKSRDITLPIKVRLVKAMVFLVVMYGCESWIVKKAEHQRIDAFDNVGIPFGAIQIRHLFLLRDYGNNILYM